MLQAILPVAGVATSGGVPSRVNVRARQLSVGSMVSGLAGRRKKLRGPSEVGGGQ